MAEKGEVMEKSVEELEKEITCAICHEHYTEPRVLPCLHYYCQDCIQALAKRAGENKPFSCPECRSDTTLPQGGVASLKPAFFINRMKAVHSKLSRAQGKVEAICEDCSGDKAIAFCRQCTQFICEECVRIHKKLKTFSGHKTVSLEELKEGGAREVVIEEAPFPTCPEHDEKMKIYCFDCSRLICRDCTINDHNGHKREFIKKSAPKVRKELLKEVVGLKEVREAFLQSVEEIKSSKSEVQAGVSIATARIKNSFKELHQILEQHEQGLIKKAIDSGAKKLEHLSAQEKKLSISHGVIQSVIDYTEQFVEHSADDQVMRLHADVQSRIRQEIKERKCEDLCPVEEADIGVEVSCAGDLKQLCQDKAKLTRFHTVTGYGDGIRSAEVSKKSEIFVTAKLSNGKPARRNLSFECYLKSLVNDSITECQVDRVEGGYRIQYTPTVRGRHEVILSAPGLQIAGSPFPVFASINPTQLVKPVREITEGFPENPVHLSLGSHGEVIVTGADYVVTFNREGEKVASLNLYEEHKLSPFGVAVDSDDMVYIPCHGRGNFLIKLNPGLKMVKKSDKINNSNLRNASIISGELMVCDEVSKSVQVFTKELELARKINFRFKIHEISSDGYGNLYVCGSKSPVHVYKNDGQFLRSFGGDKLTNPWALQVAGNYTYVSDKDSHDVLIYTTGGEYIASLRKQANCNFDKPWGVSTGRDGFIYICDTNNKRIVIF